MFSKHMLSESIINLVEGCAAGRYQARVLRTGCWSNARLRGKAQKWGARYTASRNSLAGKISHKLNWAYPGWKMGIRTMVVDSRARLCLVLTGPGGGEYLYR